MAAEGPHAEEWLLAIVRGLHPARWIVATVGLLWTMLTAVLAEAAFAWAPPDFVGWWQQPWEHLQRLGALVGDQTLGTMLFRGAVLFVVNCSVWSLLGAWIARHELLARAPQRDFDEPRQQRAPSALVVGWGKSIVMGCPCIILILGFLLLPLYLAGWVNALGSVGAILVALLLPLILILDLFVLLIACGIFVWPLQAVTVAAECSDMFDALSRSYNYAFMRPGRYLLLVTAAVVCSCWPIAVVYYGIETALALPLDTRNVVYLLAGGFGLATFWTLLVWLYLHLRSVIDETDASELAEAGHEETAPREPTAATEPTAAPEQPTDLATAARTIGTTRPALPTTLYLTGAMVGTWALTYWLFAQTPGETGWLGWGWGEGFVPNAEGGYKVASIIAGFWGFCWVIFPAYQYFRRRRPQPMADGEIDPTPES